MPHCIVAHCLVNISALISNFALIHSLAAGRRIGLVVKGDGYGHGALGVAQLFDGDPRVDYFLTAGLAEAIDLRMAGIQKPIMAMAYCDGDILQALAYGIEPSVATYDELYRVHECAVRLEKEIAVHIKVDTGIARRGIAWHEVGVFYGRAVALKNLFVKSIFTHCADSSPEDTSFMYEQQRRYEVALVDARALGFSGITHMASSGSLTLIPEYDMVRVGTMVYGSWKNEIQKKRVCAVVPEANLVPALTLRSPISVGSRICYAHLGFKDAYCVVAGARLLFSCGCFGVISQVHEHQSVIKLSCSHQVTHADFVGPWQGILPVDVAKHQATIANEITTRIYRHVPRVYYSE